MNSHSQAVPRSLIVCAFTRAASFLYQHPAPEYRQQMNKKGEVNPDNQEWQRSNNTYPVSYGLGVIIVTLGLLVALYPVLPQASAIGRGLLVLMCFTTLSFLVTTPKAWVPALGDAHHGFPYLSGVGRFIIKDSIMLGAAVLTMADSAKTYLVSWTPALASAPDLLDFNCY